MVYVASTWTSSIWLVGFLASWHHDRFAQQGVGERIGRYIALAGSRKGDKRCIGDALAVTTPVYSQSYKYYDEKQYAPAYRSLQSMPPMLRMRLI